MDRFITAATAARLNHRVVVTHSQTHFESYNILHHEPIHWYVVADGDTRISPIVPMEQLVAESDDDRRDQFQAAVTRSFEANRK